MYTLYVRTKHSSQRENINKRKTLFDSFRNFLYCKARRVRLINIYIVFRSHIWLFDVKGNLVRLFFTICVLR